MTVLNPIQQKQTYPPQKRKQITYQNRKSNKYPTTNNNKCIQNKIPNQILHNIKPISSKEIKNTNIRKCAHQQAHEKIKNTDTKIRTDLDRIPKNNSQTTSIENKKTKSVYHRNIQFMDTKISPSMKHPYIRTIIYQIISTIKTKINRTINKLTPPPNTTINKTTKSQNTGTV